MKMEEKTKKTKKNKKKRKKHTEIEQSNSLQKNKYYNIITLNKNTKEIKVHVQKSIDTH